MPRKRWVYRNGEAIEVPLDYDEPPRGADEVLWNDRSYQDMGDSRFRSRSEHREYMARRGLTTADDFKGEWAQAAKQRDEFYTKAPDKTRAQDVAQAIDTLRRQNGRRYH